MLFQSIVKKDRISKRDNILFSNEVLPISVASNDNLIIETNFTETSKRLEGKQKREDMIVQAASREYLLVLICCREKKRDIEKVVRLGERNEKW